jgi:2-polyprenyl-3-methyl-5-hydroxy-6-metoxy-1,4-benzoquinol methylase
MDNEFRPCPVCGNSDRVKINVIGELKPTFHFTKNTIPLFELVECLVCTTIYQTPLPSDAVFHELYIDAAQFTSDTYTGERTELIVDYFKVCAQYMMNRMGKNTDLRVLEIGSGLSWMCNAVKRLDSKSYTIAQDISPECQHICSWVDKYIVGSCEENYDLLEKNGLYDIISLTHVIEHLPYPLDFTMQIAPLLSSRGILFITAPYQPLEWKNAGNDIKQWQAWSYNHVPGHLQYLTENSIQVMSRVAKLKITLYDNTHDNGQAFELMLSKSDLNQVTE